MEQIELKSYNFKVVYGCTRKGKKMIDRYEYGLQNMLFYLEDCYKKYSVSKEQAWSDCRKMYRELEGVNFVITGYQCMSFSVAFKVPKWNAIIYITKDYNYCILL